MKASDLRIGNFTYDSYGIHEVSINTFQYDRERGYYFNQLNPIPLTEEWFPKLGFTSLGANYWLGNFYYNAERNTLSWFGIMLHPMIWNEVHKFQNLYPALTGQELKLTDK